MEFVFDPEKARKNLRKHGLDFSVAEAIFDDEHGFSVDDSHHDGEYRYRRFGAIGLNFRLLIAVYMFPDPDDEDLVRIISIRKATKAERRQYEAGVE
jgi:uncharacterized DUF497 family protein